jgi:hypothetical protein
MTKDELLKSIEQRRAWDKAEQAGYDEAMKALNLNDLHESPPYTQAVRDALNAGCGYPQDAK